jgi:hypothetical protein
MLLCPGAIWLETSVAAPQACGLVVIGAWNGVAAAGGGGTAALGAG